MRSSSREEIVEVLDALEAGYKRALDLTFDVLTTPERLRVLATDRAAVADFQAFCRETGHALLAWSEEAGVFSFVIRRRVDDPQRKGS